MNVDNVLHTLSVRIHNYYSGHQDAKVRRCLLKMLKPFCTHSHLSNSAAMMLLNYIEVIYSIFITLTLINHSFMH